MTLSCLTRRERGTSPAPPFPFLMTWKTSGMVRLPLALEAAARNAPALSLESSSAFMEASGDGAMHGSLAAAAVRPLASGSAVASAQSHVKDGQSGGISSGSGSPKHWLPQTSGHSTGSSPQSHSSGVQPSGNSGSASPAQLASHQSPHESSHSALMQSGSGSAQPRSHWPSSYQSFAAHSS